MNLSKVNFFLILLILVGLVALFLQNVKTGESVDFSEKRIDQLEKRPLTADPVSTPFEVAIPTAGSSGQIDMTPLFKYIDQKFATLSASPVPSKTGTPAPVASNGRKVTYLPIFGGDSETTSTGWVDVVGSDFEFTVSDFGPSSYISWDAVGIVIGGSGTMNLRIFDTTHSVVVPGSEIGLSSAKTSVSSSGKLIFLGGTNTYRIQISSQTSSPVQFNFGRVKVVY